MKKANYIVFDVETGGLNSRPKTEKGKEERANPITQIALQVLDHLTFKEIDRFETFVAPYEGLEITAKALEASMVTMAQINKGMEYKKLVKLLVEFFKKHNKPGKGNQPILVGHNVKFDIGFLEVLFQYCDKNLWEYVSEHRQCTQVLAKQAWDLEIQNDDTVSYQLGICCRRAGIKLTDAHGAMNDVIATGKLFAWFSNRLRTDSVEIATESGNEKVKKTRDFYQF